MTSDIESHRIRRDDQIVLALSVPQASYLHNLLYYGVGGPLLADDAELGSVRGQLRPLLSARELNSHSISADGRVRICAEEWTPQDEV